MDNLVVALKKVFVCMPADFNLCILLSWSLFIFLRRCHRMDSGNDLKFLVDLYWSNEVFSVTSSQALSSSSTILYFSGMASRAGLPTTRSKGGF